jgi:hydroxyacylglutathione hydrolase
MVGSVTGGAAGGKLPGMGTLVIEPIACLKDNYAYLIHESGGTDAYLVDPSESGPVAEALARSNLVLRGILATHHHQDHVGGIADLVAQWGPSLGFVAGHASDRGRIPKQTAFVAAPLDRFVRTELTIAGRPVLARHIPGHTRGAIAWGLGDGAAGEEIPTDVFTGDTLFAAGCGRLFEGTPADMFGSLGALTGLPPETRLWFGHEYTASNLRFAEFVEPDNKAVLARRAGLGGCTTPTTVALERATNPFVRAASIDVLAERRAAKDNF